MGDAAAIVRSRGAATALPQAESLPATSGPRSLGETQELPKIHVPAREKSSGSGLFTAGLRRVSVAQAR